MCYPNSLQTHFFSTFIFPFHYPTMNKFNEELKIDDQARTLCKPLGCKVVRCLGQLGMAQCQGLIRELNQCIQRKKQEIRAGKIPSLEKGSCTDD